MDFKSVKGKIMNEPKTILCYGDSNTYGYNPQNFGRYEKSKRWTSILADKLGDGYCVIPEGLNGRTTAYPGSKAEWQNGLSYILPCIATHKSVDVLIIMLGTNDCLKCSGLALNDITAGMERLLAAVKTVCPDIQSFVPEIILVAPASINHNIGKSPFSDDLDDAAILKSEALGMEYKALAEKYGCRFIDCSGMVEVSDTDCIHLSENGHKQLAQLVYDKFSELK